MKLWTLIGIPLVISAVPQLSKANTDARKLLGSTNGDKMQLEEHSKEKGSTESSIHIPKTLDSALEAQGDAFMQKIYLHNLPMITRTWGLLESDFLWLEKRIIYGLFLSDHSVLSMIEAELVTLCGILAQGLRQPAMWHVRGLMRLGVSMEDTEGVCDVVKMVAKWAGKEGTERWIRADEVDPEFF